MKNVVIIGTGGHAKVVADIVLSSKDHLLGFLTSDTGIKSFMGWPVLGRDTEYEPFLQHQFVVAIGNAVARERIVSSMNQANAKWYTAIHPSAMVSAVHSTIGEGSVVMPYAVINPCAQIGAHCIVNSNATVEHDNQIGDFAHISVGAKLAGTVVIGRRTWVGVGAAVRDKVRICQDCMIGAGAVVVKNIEVPGIYVGVPARRVK